MTGTGGAAEQADPDGKSELVRSTHERGVTTLTLDSPHNRNALSKGLVSALYEGLERAADDPSVRAVLLTHTGSTFCAGADLREGSGSPADMAALLRAIVELPKPVVARVEGHVRAGGTGLLGACDISVAGPGSTFAFTEARIGVAPAVISMPLLPRLDARAAARYYLTGERFDAAEAARIGLVTLAAGEDRTAAARTWTPCWSRCSTVCGGARRRGSRSRSGWSRPRCCGSSTATPTASRSCPRVCSPRRKRARA